MIDAILRARELIRDAIAYTPCPLSIPLSELTGARIYCKLDNLQRTGSFKERGARHALLQLAPEAKARGVIAASAGNHALGLAYHGRLLGILVTVVMPETAPLIKVSTCRRLGAEVLLHGAAFAQAKARAHELCAERGLSYIDGFDDPAIIAGQGTLGLEICEQVPDLDAVIVPVGGGGLLAGVGCAVKSRRPQAQIIGVEATHAASFHAALAAGGPVDCRMEPTLADGLAVPRVGANAYALAVAHADRFLTVTEEEISLAILRIVELEKGIVEGAAATTLAAFFHDKLPELAGKKCVLLLCGGNIDPNVLSHVLEKGLVADGRLSRFTVVIKDRPGGLAELTALIAATGASVQEIQHERAFAGADISAVQVLCKVETRDRAHLAELHAALAREGIRCLG